MFVIQIDIPGFLPPLERGELYDLPLCDIFDELEDGDIIGAGTNSTSGTIESCDVQFETSDIDRLMPYLLELLETANAPTGTVIRQLEPTQLDLHVVK